MNQTTNKMFSEIERIFLQIIDLYYLKKYDDKEESIIRQAKKVFKSITESSLSNIEKAYLMAVIVDSLLEDKKIKKREILRQIPDAKKLIQVKTLMLAKRIEPIVSDLSSYAENYLYCYSDKNPLGLSDLVDKLRSLRKEFTIPLNYDDFRKIYIETLKRQETIGDKLSRVLNNLSSKFEQLALHKVATEINVIPHTFRRYLDMSYKYMSTQEMQFFEIIFYLLRFPQDRAKIIEFIKALKNPYSKFVLGILLLRLDDKIYDLIRNIILESAIQILEELLSEPKKSSWGYDLVRLSCLYKELPFDLKQIIYGKISPSFRKILLEYLSKQILGKDLEIFIKTYNLFEDFLTLLRDDFLKAIDDFSLERMVDFALNIITSNMPYISRESIRLFFKELFEVRLETAVKYLYDVKSIDPELYEELLDFVWNKLLELKETNAKVFFKILLSAYEPLNEKYNNIKKLLKDIPMIVKKALENRIISPSYAISLAGAIRKYSEECEKDIINIVSTYLDEAKEEIDVKMLEKSIWFIPKTPEYNNLLLKALILIGQSLSIENVDNSTIKRICEIESQIIRTIPREILNGALKAFKPWVKKVVNFMFDDPQILEQLKIDEKTFFAPWELYQGSYSCLERILFRYKEINDREITAFLENIFRRLIGEIKPEKPPEYILRTLFLLRLFSEIIDSRDICEELLEKCIDLISKDFSKHPKVRPSHLAIVLNDLIHDIFEITKYILSFISKTNSELTRLILFEILEHILDARE